MWFYPVVDNPVDILGMTGEEGEIMSSVLSGKGGAPAPARSGR